MRQSGEEHHAERSDAAGITRIIRGLFAPEDADLVALTRAAQEAGMPTGWEIMRDVGRLFQVLCRAVGARRVLEFGTLAGHSALWFARALPQDGKVITSKSTPRMRDFAREQLAQRAGGKKVEVREGGARDGWRGCKPKRKQAAKNSTSSFWTPTKRTIPNFWTGRLRCCVRADCCWLKRAARRLVERTNPARPRCR